MLDRGGTRDIEPLDEDAKIHDLLRKDIPATEEFVRAEAGWMLAVARRTA